MLTTAILVVEVCVLLGSLVDFGNLRLVSGTFFNARRKILAGQAVMVLILVVFLQIVGTAQNEQHDGASKSIASRLGSAIQSYTSNSGGTSLGFRCTPDSYCSGIVDPDTFTQPVEGVAATPDSGVVYILGKDCQGNASTTGYAIFYWQRQGAGHSQCLDSR
jgi:hypothetical protein